MVLRDALQYFGKSIEMIIPFRRLMLCCTD